MTIVLTWLVHCLFIGAVLTAGAYAWEAGARWSGGPARWGWLAALAGTVTLPWLVRLVPERAAEALPVAIPVLALEPLELAVASGGGGPGAAGMALLLWLGSSVLALTYVAVLVVRLRRARRRWRELELDGGRVLVTRGIGPAAVGVLSAMVVVPAWALELEAELRALLLRHEREHVAAGDPRLLLAGLVLLAAMPWNPLVWLQVLRLRNAIELDCDARVLASGADPERYGSLLLEVGRRRGSGALVMATFAEPRVFLEERIRRIARWPLHRRRGRALLFALLGAALFGTAMCAPDPLRQRPLPTGPAEGEIVSDAAADVRAQPTFTPMTDRPELQNIDEVRAALARAYPPLLRDAGIGGSPLVWIYIDEQGAVTRLQLSRSSGYPALDQAALSVASGMRFSPALNRGQRVGVWIELPLVFRTGEAAAAVQVPDARAVDEVRRSLEISEQVRAARRAGVPQPLGVPEAGADISAGPVFTPMTVRPELQNRQAAASALLRAYPPLLRDAGIGGAPVIWFFIDEDGQVRRTQLSKSSGYPALDEAALSVAAQMQFTPALNRDRRVAVWVEIPVVFTAR